VPVREQDGRGLRARGISRARHISYARGRESPVSRAWVWATHLSGRRAASRRGAPGLDGLRARPALDAFVAGHDLSVATVHSGGLPARARSAPLRTVVTAEHNNQMNLDPGIMNWYVDSVIFDFPPVRMCSPFIALGSFVYFAPGNMSMSSSIKSKNPNH
jgi:hypothetical protein